MDNAHSLSTGNVSPQYHMVFNYLFETVFGTGNNPLLDDICKRLFDSDCNSHFNDNELTSNDPIMIHLLLIKCG